MRKQNLMMTLSLILFVLFSFGCSNDNPVSPPPTGDFKVDEAAKARPSTLVPVTIYGNVYFV